ncbi:hypothetical protein [Piscinibacter terrae]|uniref:Uncharacterized protein n=1 Tax=Piscinibacter terrae TaxID=2496871 RepID=A0A3N7HS79_9BURK|nr:hypothetical protein [Albitalea terrae]RQP24076.1 hypothetical protein DZC73_12130 [Albitalea terrae]
MIQPIPTVSRRRTSIWLWVLLTLLALSVLVVMTAFQWVGSLEALPAHVVIDGREISIDPALFGGWTATVLFIPAVMVVFCVLVIVPLVLLFALACALIGVVLGVALPIIAVVVALSPIWLMGMFFWWLARRAVPRTAQAA